MSALDESDQATEPAPHLLEDDSEHSASPSDTDREGEAHDHSGMSHASNEAMEEGDSSDKEARKARRGTRKGSRKRHPSKPTKRAKEAPTISDKILEARKDFDEALERIKSSRGGRRAVEDFAEPVDLDGVAMDLRRRMDKALENDLDAIESDRPALARQKILPTALDILNKKHLHEVLLDNGILTSISGWLEPLPNRTLPAQNIRRSMLEAVKTMGVETDHLRESRIGKIVLYLSRRPNEVPEIQRLAKELIAKWSRPILGDRVGVPTASAEGPEGEFPGRGIVQSESLLGKSGRLEDVRENPHHKLAAHMQKLSRTQSKRSLKQ